METLICDSWIPLLSHTSNVWADFAREIRSLSYYSGSTINSGDLSSQQVAIGPLHFRAIDYGDPLQLNECAKRKLAPSDREERNLRTLAASAAGLSASNNHPNTLPARSRATQSDLEVRITEWRVGRPFAESAAYQSLRAKTILSLRRDIGRANRDMDYRSFRASSSPFLRKDSAAIRVSDVFHSRSGDASLQINILGD